MADTRELLVKFRTEGVDQVQGAVGGLSKSLGSFASASVESSRQVAFGLATVATAAAGILGFGAKIAGDFESAHKGFITILGSAQKAGEVMARIKEEAAKTPFELKGLTQAVQALSIVNKDGNKSIDILLNVGKALAAAGKGQAELDRIIANIQQIGLTGKITEMDIRQFGMNGVNVLELLGEYYGVTTAKAGEMVKDSKDAFGDLSKAFAKAGGAGGKFATAFTDQMGTFNQLMSNLKDIFTITMADIVTKSGAFDVIKNAIGSVTKFLGDNKDKISGALKASFEWIQKNAPLVAGVILGALTPAFLALAASIGGILLTLAPFMIVGALLAPLVMKWVDSVGGLNNAMAIASDAIKSVYNAVQMLITGDFKGGIFGLQEDDPWINALLTLREVLVDLGKKAFKFLADAARVLVQVFNFLKPSLVALLEAFKPLGESLLNLFKSLQPILAVILPIIGVALVAAIWLFINALRIVVQTITVVVNIFTGFVNFLKGVVAFIFNIPNMLTMAWSAIVAGVSTMITTLVGWFTQGVSSIVTTVLTLPERIAFAFGAMAAFLLIKVPEIVNGVVNWFAQLPGRIWNTIVSLPGVVGGIFNNVKNTVVNFLSQLVSGAAQKASEVGNSIVNTLMGLPGRLGGMGQALGQAVGDAIRNIPRFLGDVWSWASNIAKAIGKAIADKMGALSGAFKAGWKAAGGPAFLHGGVVPGAPGQEVPIVAHAGERVIPRTGVDVNSGKSGSGVTVNFYGDMAIDSEERVTQLANEVKRILDRENKRYSLGAL